MCMGRWSKGTWAALVAERGQGIVAQRMVVVVRIPRVVVVAERRLRASLCQHAYLTRLVGMADGRGAAGGGRGLPS